MNPAISVVTVTYNAELCVAETIKSVLSQTFEDFEYIFIDGKSSDRTISIIESFRSAFEEKGIPFIVVSEEDSGIYDAMNKGISRASGNWVQMLNAGDCLTDSKVLQDVFSEIEESSEVLYGNTVLCDSGYYKVINACKLETIIHDMPFCHQSVFVKRSVLQEYGFDTKYRYAADYDQLLRAYLEGKCFKYVNRLISVYDTSGESEKNFQRTIEEQQDIRRCRGIVQADCLKRVLFKRKVAKFLKKFLPIWSRSENRGWYRSLGDVQRDLK